ncbi:MAG: hypothetical protein C4527_01185 [Candidatus Omnitrophota bacterium]|jgi:hypothetical protein|nr:MAG: hypothetical protein C4527_01185 [Candidatus Omnitrophota bacterium]
MKDTEIIEALRSKLAVQSGRHLYGVLGSYPALNTFAEKLSQVKTHDGKYFPKPISVNRGILDSIPDGEFRDLVENEAKRPEPTATHVKKAFEIFLRSKLQKNGLVVLASMEMLFAYPMELNLLRSIAADEHKIVLLLPGRRSSGKIIMFPDLEEGSYMLPTNLIAENHLWEIRD